MPFEFQPVLKGTLLELRPLRADDYDDLYAVAADPLIWEQHPERHRHEAATFQRFFQDGLASGGALIATDARTGRIIGSSRFDRYDADRRRIEIGWTFLARSHWGGTVNGELKSLMLGHALRFVETVVFLVGPGNVRSQRAVEKLGAVRAGERPDAFGGRSYVYAIARR